MNEKLSKGKLLNYYTSITVIKPKLKMKPITSMEMTMAMTIMRILLLLYHLARRLISDNCVEVDS